MKNGKLDAFALFALKDDIQEAIEKAQIKQTEVKMSEPLKQEAPKNSNQKRIITWEEIKRITSKYGFKEDNEDDYATGEDSESNVFMSYRWRGMFHVSRSIMFSPSFLRLNKADYVWGEPDFSYLFYSALRTSPQMDSAYLEKLLLKKFGDIPEGYLEKTLSALMEIKNLE